MKKHRITENTSIYACLKGQIVRLTRSVDLKSFASLFIKYFAIITLGIYLIGTCILLFRSWCENIPFVLLDITRLTIIDVYFLVILIAFLACEYWICELWRLMRLTGGRTAEKIITKIILVMSIFLIGAAAAFVLGVLIDNFLGTTCIIGFLFIALPCYLHMFVARLSPKMTAFIESVFIILCTCIIVYNIPLNIGGLAPQNVQYCIDDTKCQEYAYYGSYNEMLILKDANEDVVLEPIGRGYMRYKTRKKDTSIDTSSSSCYN